jgi:hypothetical protein
MDHVAEFQAFGGTMRKAVLSICAVLLLSGCVVADDRRGDGPVIKSGGPPPWAPAHGRRAKAAYRYYYYPAAGVYFNVSTRTYFYPNGGTWQVSATLPPAVVIDAGDYVSLQLETEKPYLYYAEHKTKYKVNNGKKKGNGHWKKNGKPF